MTKKGVLYIVATPIGNLEDISLRAIGVLQSVDFIAAEDTRHSQKLLAHLGIKNTLISLHDYNERSQSGELLEKITQGASLALISDAGTPLISDPGYVLVQMAHVQGIRVVPIPGACALIAALSASGLPTDRFVFEGFLPEKPNARRKALEHLKLETRTLIFYEAPHRILESLRALVEILGGEREATLARELTKTFETIRFGTLAELLGWVENDVNQTRGEIVLLVKGAKAPDKTELTAESLHILKILMTELSLKDAVGLTAKMTGIQKQLLYKSGLDLSKS